MKRALAAVMMADVCEYTRLVAENEDVAVERMLQLRTETIQPLVNSFDGQVIDYAGDGALVRFRAAAKAVACGVALQRELLAREARIEPGRRFRLRIGLDMGRVIVTDSGIAGKHVNIAARLEGLAPVGGICLSERVYAASTDRQRQVCRNGGLRQLKHITEPVSVWFWQSPAAARQARQSNGVMRADIGVDVGRQCSHRPLARASLH